MGQNINVEWSPIFEELFHPFDSHVVYRPELFEKLINEIDRQGMIQGEMAENDRKFDLYEGGTFRCISTMAPHIKLNTRNLNVLARRKHWDIDGSAIKFSEKTISTINEVFDLLDIIWPRGCINGNRSHFYFTLADIGRILCELYGVDYGSPIGQSFCLEEFREDFHNYLLRISEDKFYGQTIKTSVYVGGVYWYPVPFHEFLEKNSVRFNGNPYVWEMMQNEEILEGRRTHDNVSLQEFLALDYEVKEPGRFAPLFNSYRHLKQHSSENP